MESVNAQTLSEHGTSPGSLRNEFCVIVFIIYGVLLRTNEYNTESCAVLRKKLNGEFLVVGGINSHSEVAQSYPAIST